MRALTPVLAALAALTLAFIGPAEAQSQATVPQTGAQVKMSFAPVVHRVTPGVVNVYASHVEKQQRNPFLDDPVFRRFFGGDNGQPRERVQRSLGSGVIIDPAGFVVTNQHVIEGATEVKVSLSDKREFEAEIVLRDPRTDLAVLKIKGGDKFAALDIGDSDALEVGDIVLAIGNPFGVGQTVTTGIVSALARTQVGVSDYQFFIQTDAAINPGNSGGALVDSAGRLIGINTAIFSQSGGSHGIGFAIPVNMVKVVVASAKMGGKQVRRPWFGGRLQVVSSEIAESLGLDRPVGALVASTVPKGPAAEAGLKPGDVIMSVDGQAVDDPDGFGFRIGTKPVGGTATLSVRRSGKTISVPVALVQAPETRPRDVRTLKGRWPLAGAVIANMSPAVAEELSMDTATEGVVVTEVQDNTPAAELGLKKGDLIVSIDEETVSSTKDVEALGKTRNYYWKLSVGRDGQVVTTVVGG
jgi:Do/DeqQ family serine protease